MRNHPSENQTVNCITGEVALRSLLERSAKPESDEFRNWLHKPEPMQEFRWGIDILSDFREANVPGVVRYLMQYAYQAGQQNPRS